jgi:hypothetical protein
MSVLAFCLWLISYISVTCRNLTENSWLVDWLCQVWLGHVCAGVLSLVDQLHLCDLSQPVRKILIGWLIMSGLVGACPCWRSVSGWPATSLWPISTCQKILKNPAWLIDWLCQVWLGHVRAGVLSLVDQLHLCDLSQPVRKFLIGWLIMSGLVGACPCWHSASGWPATSLWPASTWPQHVRSSESGEPLNILSYLRGSF